MKRIMKNGLVLLVVMLLCVFVVPFRFIKAEGSQLHIVTDCSGGSNIIVDFDTSVDNDSTSIPGLTINYDDGFFIIDVNNGKTVSLNGFFEDDVENLIWIEGSDCGLKFTGKGTLNLIAKTNPNEDDHSYSYFVNSGEGDIYIGNSGGGPTINLSADVDEDDETPYNELSGFQGDHFYLQKSTINVEVCGFLFDGVVGHDDVPVADRVILTLDNTKINSNFHRLNDYDTNNEKDMCLIIVDDPESYGDVNIKNNSKITVTCLDADLASVDPSYIGQNSIANCNIDNSSLEMNVSNVIAGIQTRYYEGDFAVNVTNGSSIKIHSDDESGYTCAIYAGNINVVDSSLDLKMQSSPFIISGDTAEVNFTDSDIKIDVDEGINIFSDYSGGTNNLPDTFEIKITTNGVTQVWTQDDIGNLPTGDIKIEGKKSNDNPPSPHVVLNTGVN